MLNIEINGTFGSNPTVGFSRRFNNGSSTVDFDKVIVKQCSEFDISTSTELEYCRHVSYSDLIKYPFA